MTDKIFTPYATHAIIRYPIPRATLDLYNLEGHRKEASALEMIPRFPMTPCGTDEAGNRVYFIRAAAHPLAVDGDDLVLAVNYSDILAIETKLEDQS
ncbi:MAG: hypothetical protein WC455_10230 [Dehalococcoidia bacterium]|jgi:hypothetical protein